MTPRSEKTGFKLTKVELRETSYDIPDISGESEQQFQERLKQFGKELLTTGMKEFWACWQDCDKKSVGFRLPGAPDEVLDFEMMLSELSSYLRATARLLQNAKERFADLPEQEVRSCGCGPIAPTSTVDS